MGLPKDCLWCQLKQGVRIAGPLTTVSFKIIKALFFKINFSFLDYKLFVTMAWRAGKVQCLINLHMTDLWDMDKMWLQVGIACQLFVADIWY